jgi:transposase-like protein
VPEFEKRWDRLARPVDTWRVDETYIPIRGKWHHLYRAVDKHGLTVDFLLRPDRDIAAAQAFFRKALASNALRVPRKVTLDGHVPSRRALWLLRREHPCWRNVTVRIQGLIITKRCHQVELRQRTWQGMTVSLFPRTSFSRSMMPTIASK